MWVALHGGTSSPQGEQVVLGSSPLPRSAEPSEANRHKTRDSQAFLGILGALEALASLATEAARRRELARLSKAETASLVRQPRRPLNRDKGSVCAICLRRDEFAVNT
jgi:hypothetical protein